MRHHTFQALSLALAPRDGGGPPASIRPKADATGRHPDSILPPAPTQTSAPATGQAQRHPARERPWRHWSRTDLPIRLNGHRAASILTNSLFTLLSHEKTI